MSSSVKAKQPKKESSFLALLWLGYFLLTIGVVGLGLAIFLAFPIYLLSRFYKPLEKTADFIMQKGIFLLMLLQPWYRAKVNLNLPPLDSKNGVLLVSNHRSTLDVFILLSRVEGIKILAKADLFKIPFLSLMMKASNQIPVPRGQLNSFFLAMDTVLERLQKGHRVHVFPEMTRCSRGFQGIRSFSAAPFQAAIKANSIIQPIVFKGTDDVWPKGAAGLQFRNPVEAFSLEPIQASDFSSVEALKNEVQNRFSVALQ